MPVSYRNNADAPATAPAANTRLAETVPGKTGTMRAELSKASSDTGMTFDPGLGKPNSHKTVTIETPAAIGARQ